MRVEDALHGVSAILLDSAPVIYHLEQHPIYAPLMRQFFAARTERGIAVVTSPITLAECLVHPIRRGLTELEVSYTNLIVRGQNTRFHPIGEAEGVLAARFRAEHGLKLADAFQAAVAVRARCEAILTNDPHLKGLPEIRRLVLDELKPA